MLSSVAIGRALERVHLDGSSWLFDNPMRSYRSLKLDLIQCLRGDYGWSRISDDSEVIRDLRCWRDSTSNWETVLRVNDVAMFPPVLAGLRSLYLCEFDKKYCETVTRLSYMASIDLDGNGEWYHGLLEDFRAEYGVFRFRAVIGSVLFKQLRRHLQVDLEDFTSVYGPGLHDDPCFCDELLVEMLVSGRLRGPVRGYKLDGEYYY